MKKGWLVVRKKEMTKIRMDEKFVPVTVVELLPQEIVRYKTAEKDGYLCAVVGVEKKQLKKEKGQKIEYTMVTEFGVDEWFVQGHEAGKALDASFLEWVTVVDVIWFSKGKGFQGMVKKWHVKGMWATHGHKFTRTGGSKGNRKPRRTMKWHPHAGHMGTERITLKDIQIVDSFDKDKEHLFVLRGSLPGAYNWLLSLIIK